MTSAPSRESESSASGFRALEFKIKVSALTTGTSLARLLVQRRRHLFTALAGSFTTEIPYDTGFGAQGLQTLRLTSFGFWRSLSAMPDEILIG